MVEPLCPLMRGTTNLRGLLRNDGSTLGTIYLGSDGNVGFMSHPDGYGGLGFEIKYQCPKEEVPCEDAKGNRLQIEHEYCLKILR